MEKTDNLLKLIENGEDRGLSELNIVLRTMIGSSLYDTADPLPVLTHSNLPVFTAILDRLFGFNSSLECWLLKMNRHTILDLLNPSDGPLYTIFTHDYLTSFEELIPVDSSAFSTDAMRYILDQKLFGTLSNRSGFSPIQLNKKEYFFCAFASCVIHISKDHGWHFRANPFSRDSSNVALELLFEYLHWNIPVDSNDLNTVAKAMMQSLSVILLTVYPSFMNNNSCLPNATLKLSILNMIIHESFLLNEGVASQVRSIFVRPLFLWIGHTLKNSFASTNLLDYFKTVLEIYRVFLQPWKSLHNVKLLPYFMSNRYTSSWEINRLDFLIENYAFFSVLVEDLLVWFYRNKTNGCYFYPPFLEFLSVFDVAVQKAIADLENICMLNTTSETIALDQRQLARFEFLVGRSMAPRDLFHSPSSTSRYLASELCINANHQLKSIQAKTTNPFVSMLTSTIFRQTSPATISELFALLSSIFQLDEMQLHVEYGRNIKAEPSIHGTESESPRIGTKYDRLVGVVKEIDSLPLWKRPIHSSENELLLHSMYTVASAASCAIGWDMERQPLASLRYLAQPVLFYLVLISFLTILTFLMSFRF